jgi:ADP-ribose pyrophosphatase YjhB (NUDIX family)
MKREYPSSPLVGVGAIIIADERVMLVKRGNPPLAGEWSIPGGLLELGETVRSAVIREAGEETGLKVEPLILLGAYDRLLKDEDGRVLYHYVLIDFLCRRVSGEPQASDDATDARWFTKPELSLLPLADDALEVIRLGFEHAQT